MASSSTDPRIVLLEQLADCIIPGDPDLDHRVRSAAIYSGTPVEDIEDSDVIEAADGEFLCSEVSALWTMVRAARALLRRTDP